MLPNARDCNRVEAFRRVDSEAETRAPPAADLLEGKPPILHRTLAVVPGIRSLAMERGLSLRDIEKDCGALKLRLYVPLLSVVVRCEEQLQGASWASDWHGTAKRKGM